MVFLNAPKSLHPTVTYTKMLKHLRHQLTKSLRSDRQQWWTRKFREIQEVGVADYYCNTDRLRMLVHEVALR